ncbi:hypothetical protein EB795_02545 [Pseudomonas mandelii]|nr:hypothetical protein [Pseudomonas mandelii]
MLDVSKYTSIWIKVDRGILLSVSGPLVVTEIVSTFLFAYRKTGGYTEYLLYKGSARKMFRDIVETAIEGRVQKTRSYGASR